MKIEPITAVETRARLHAALSDPTRLAIIDTLTFGDASPSELQHALGLSSNLIAHHIGVLQHDGFITRTRSEGDRRRSYLRLEPGALDRLLPAGRRHVPRIVFVCTAASARSQIAASLWRRISAVPAIAAGTHPDERIATGTIQAARRHNLPLRRVRPVHLDQIRRDDDFIITVCDRAHEELGALPDAHWSVPDPAPAGTSAAFDEAYQQLDARVRQLAPRVAAAG